MTNLQVIIQVQVEEGWVEELKITTRAGFVDTLVCDRTQLFEKIKLMFLMFIWMFRKSAEESVVEEV